MAVLRVQQPTVRSRERSYAIHVLLEEFLGLGCECSEHDNDHVRITAVGEPGRELWMPDIFLPRADRHWLEPASLPDWPLKAFETGSICDASGPNSTIPVLFGREDSTAARGSTPSSRFLDLDVFGTSFYLLSRYEEAVAGERDAHGRFPLSSSVSAKAGFVDRPLVNEYLEVLWSVLHDMWPALTRKPRNYRALLSHDVDDLSVCDHSAPHVGVSIMADLFRRREPVLAYHRVKSFARSRFGLPHYADDPYNTFSFIMDVSEKHGLKSAFYFVVPACRSSLDPPYSLSSAWARDLLGAIHKRGHEVGLHGSYAAYADPAVLGREFESLKQIAGEAGVRQQTWGGRQHFLRWRNPDTWRAWDSLGLAYDSTLIHPEQVGFRCGCCYEYPAYDLVGRRALALRERPLVVMDVTLLTYMNYTLDEAVRHVHRLIETCRRYAGDFTLLWHPNWLISSRLRSAYSRIVEDAA